MNRTKINILAYLSVTYEKNWYRDLFKALVESDPEVTVFAMERPLTLMGALLSLGRKARRPVAKDTRIINFKPLSMAHERIAYVIRPLAWLNKIMIEWQIRQVLKSYGASEGTNISWIFHPYQMLYLDCLEPEMKIYHVYDDYYFRTLDLATITRLEATVLAKADMVYSVSPRLLSKYSPKCKNIKLMPNGVSRKFEKTGQLDHVFHQINNIKKPRICSWGYVTNRLDFELILNLAKTNPNWSFIFLGETWKYLKSKWEAILNQCPNIYYIEKINWQNLAVYLSAIDIMFIPHVKNLFNAVSSPVRFMQALAMGKPLIVPDLPYAADCKNIIYFAETVDEYTAIIKKYLKSGENPVLAGMRCQYASVNSWEEKAKAIMKDITECLPA